MVSVSAFVKKHKDRLILASTGLVILITIILAAYITIKTISDKPITSKQDKASMAASQDSQPGKAADSQPGKLVQQFTQLNIFGQQKPEPAKPRKTRLSLSLHGIIDAENPETSIVIISAGKTVPETAYRIGEKLPGGATLAEVYADHIVLLNDGTREVLNLPQNTLKPSEAKFKKQR